MDDYVKEIVYSEGYSAYRQLLRTKDNPYSGVSETLERIWWDAWWDACTGDQ